MREVLGRFHPELRLNLVSVGSPGQTASSLRSPRLMEIVASAHPDLLVIGVGLADAMREPVTRRLIDRYRATRQAEVEEDSVFGAEHRVDVRALGPASDVGASPEPALEYLETFQADLSADVRDFLSVGLGCVLVTSILVGNDLENPANDVLRLYSRAIRRVAEEQEVAVADADRAFRDLFTRAATYKQKVEVTGATGELNAQGQALLARTVLSALGLLPSVGYRPPH
jgi:hypothetical protein